MQIGKELERQSSLERFVVLEVDKTNWAAKPAKVDIGAL